MRFGKSVFMLVAAVALLTGIAASGAGNGGRFFLLDQRLQFPIMCCTMPSGWLAGGKSTWTSDMANPVQWYVWAQRPDGRAKIIVSGITVFGMPGRIAQVRMLQDPRVFPQMLLEALRRDHNFTELSLTEAKFSPLPLDPTLRDKRLQQAAERGVRLSQLFCAELIARYDGRCNGEERVLMVSLPMLISESPASAMSFTTGIEMMMPMSFSCPGSEESDTRAVLQGVVKSIQLNPKYIQVTNYIVSRRVEERIKVQNHIRDQQFELARSTSQTQDRVRDMWSEYIRDVDSVANPNTGEKMFLDNRYDHAWINSENEVIYHDAGSLTFDPNIDRNFNHTNWKQLK